MNILKVNVCPLAHINSGNSRRDYSSGQAASLSGDVFARSVSFRGDKDSSSNFGDIIDKVSSNYDYVNKMEAKGSINMESVDWPYKYHRKICDSKVNDGELINLNTELYIKRCEIKNNVINHFGHTKIVDSAVIGCINNGHAPLSISGSLVKGGGILCPNSDLNIEDSILVGNNVIGGDDMNLKNCIFVHRIEDEESSRVYSICKECNFENVYFADEEGNARYIKNLKISKSAGVLLSDIFKNSEEIKNPKLKQKLKDLLDKIQE